MKKHQKFSLLSVAVALAFVGLMTTCDNFNRLVEEQRKERDAIEKTNSDLIKGLSDALSKEQELYKDSESNKELTSL